MNRAVASALSRNRHLGGLVFGLFLGQVVAMMAAREDASTLGFGVSTVFVATASASFVMFVLAQQGRDVPRPTLWAQARMLAAVIGVGLLVSLRLFA